MFDGRISRLFENLLFSAIVLCNLIISSEKERGHLFLHIHVNKVSSYAGCVFFGFAEIKLMLCISSELFLVVGHMLWLKNKTKQRPYPVASAMIPKKTSRPGCVIDHGYVMTRPISFPLTVGGMPQAAIVWQTFLEFVEKYCV